ncbi:hypothetical protein [Plantactinospora sp. B24E8]|uniref:hypothetical protein n=1 Tax=Plantactinospora sp. B24E8 TaxID=3153567 RepID=UPI00325D5DFE
MAEDESDARKKFAVGLGAVAAAISVLTFLGWDDELKQALPIADRSTTAPAVPSRQAVVTPPAVTRPDPQPTRPRPRPTPEETTPDPEDVRRAYVRQADEACLTAVEARPGPVSVLNYEWMMDVAAARERMLADWQTVSVQPSGGSNVNRVREMWQDFHEATTYWRYMANNLLARNKDGYNAELRRFQYANTSFLQRANRYGFRVCNFQWPTAAPAR